MVGNSLRKWLQCFFPGFPEDEWTTLRVESAEAEGGIELSYKIEERSGRGTFGVVSKVRTRANEILAMKQVDHTNRYKCREILMMKELKHINVVRIHYFCTQKKYSKIRDIIFMEYMPESLHGYISRFKRDNAELEPLILCCFTYQLCRGIAHLHHRNIAHRDLKPRNLLVDSSTNVLKICDLGSAKRLDDQERKITYICSRWYRAPELLFANKSYTVAIDVWSIGCCLAQMIRLEPLFKGRSTADQIRKIFRMLGSPSEEEIQSLNMVPDLIPEKRCPRTPTDEILIHSYSESQEHLLFEFLQYDPSKRPTAWTALAHDYFNELRRAHSDSSNTIPSNLFRFTDEELTYPPIWSYMQDAESGSLESDSGLGSSSPSP